jgi:hypothetical protein
MHRLTALILFVMLATGLACPAAGTAGQDPEWGTIRGQVVWGGAELPAAKTIQVTKDTEHCLAHGPIPDESWVIQKSNKGIRWVFVWLAPAPGQPKLPVNPTLAHAPDKPAQLDQPYCRFAPHALALREGQELVVKNSAPIAHNVNWTGGLKNPGNNVILPSGKSQAIKLVADRIPIQVKCNIHPWMTAWVRVFDHPYFAITDADGNFEIKLAPAGEYRLLVWQESMGFRGGAKGRTGTPVKIQAGGVTDVGKLDLKP